jgi:hypothetical protein
MGLGALITLVTLLAGTAAAQDPYGGTSTTAGEPAVAASCELSVTSGEAGASVTATVSNVPFGGTVRILFGGVEVGRGTAPLQSQSVGAPVLLGGRVLSPQAALTSLSIPFVVPDMRAGTYLVTAVGVDFTCVCNPGGAGFEVLADVIARGGGGGALPRTGIYALLLLAIAIALILLGRAFVEESRRRRRKAEWDLRAEAAGVVSTPGSRAPVTK